MRLCSADLNRWLKKTCVMVALYGVILSCSVPRPAADTNAPVAPSVLENEGRKTAVKTTRSDAREDQTTSELQGSEGPIELTVEDAILLSIERNLSLTVERLNPSIFRTFEDQERAVFDPDLTGAFSYFAEKAPLSEIAASGDPDVESGRSDLDFGASQFFPTGTTVGANLSNIRRWSDLYSDRYASRLGLSVTQALLQGRGLDVNLADLRQAELDTRFSQYELRGFIEALVAEVEKTYWDYALSQRQIQIVEASLEVATQQLQETEEIIAVGRMAETEVAAAQSEIALRRQNLIDARSFMATTRLRLLRLLNPPSLNLWNQDLLLLNQPAVPEIKLDDVASHVEVALRMRPDLNQARLGVLRNDLEIVKTKNGLLPRLDLFINLGKTGYADSFGGSVSDISKDGYDLLAGVRFEYPPRNRDARARRERAVVRREQAAEALENLAQLVQLDVRSAYIETNRAKEQIYATAATRQFQEESLRIETEKFRVGRSTNLLVAQAQRDVVSSQISEIRAVVTYLKALVDLHRLEGSLLERRGIVAPGRETVSLPTQLR
ncbi:MAG: TolC family protein [Desulfatiglandaceae bacterium]